MIRIQYFATIQSRYCLNMVLLCGRMLTQMPWKLEPINIVHRILNRIMLKHYYDNNYCTDVLFKIIKILALERLYEKVLTIKIKQIVNSKIAKEPLMKI